MALMLEHSGMLSGVIACVSVRLLVASLPPTRHRTRPKDAKTQPLGAGRVVLHRGVLIGYEPNAMRARRAQLTTSVTALGR
jgi:hypothetical protein